MASLAVDPSTRENLALPLILTTEDGRALNRNYVNPYPWKKALAAAGVESNRRNGFHALRHHYASVLLDGRVSIRALSEWLGQADPGFTLRTYTHLMPECEERGRHAVDISWGSRGVGVGSTPSESVFAQVSGGMAE